MNSALDIKKLSNSMFRIQQAANEQLKPAEFKSIALEILSNIVPFETGIWAQGRVRNKLGIVHDSFLYNYRNDFLENWIKVCDPTMPDQLLNLVIQHPGKTFDLRQSVDESFFTHPVYLDHCKKYGIEHALNTAVYSHDLNLFTSIAIYRPDLQTPFQETERLIKQYLIPSIVEAYNTCLQFALIDKANDSILTEHAFALTDNEGIVHHVNEKFSAIFWEDITKLYYSEIESFTKDLILGKRNPEGYLVKTSPLTNGMAVIQLIPVQGWETLTSRQKQIAKLLADGYEYSKIAEKLGISRSTVTNHANAIYSKLSITSKIELSKMLTSNPIG